MIVNGWLQEATRHLGPTSKGGYGGVLKSPKRGLVGHSMEGDLDVALSILNSSAQKCWTFSNPKIGKLLQHYEVEWNTWASGGPEANMAFVSVESEGVAGEPLTDTQVENLKFLIRELAAYCHFEPRRPAAVTDKVASLYEHRECVRFGSDPTACPSGRYPWGRIMAELEGDLDMTTAEELKAEIAALRGVVLKGFGDLAAVDKALRAVMLKGFVDLAGSDTAIKAELDALDARLDAISEAASD